MGHLLKRNIVWVSVGLMFLLVSCARSKTSQVAATVAAPLAAQATATTVATVAQAPTPTATVQLEPTPTRMTSATPQPTATDEGTGQATPESTATSAPPSPSPTETPTETSAPGPGQDDASACVEKAAFFADVTVPDGTFFRQGEAFTKTWRFRNEGTCTWTGDYKVVFHSGEIMDAPLSAPFPAEVAPGGMIDLSLAMKAPMRGGLYQGNWVFENPQGDQFGTGNARKDVFWVQIQVRFLDQNDQPQPDPRILPPPPVPTGCEVQRDPGFESQVLALINQARAANGLAPLTLDQRLSAAAVGHSTDMACNHFVNHSGSNGSTWYDRISVQGYAYGRATENIYVGNPQFGGTPQGAFDWWMNSQVHRDNILDPQVTEIGIGYVFSAASEFGGYYTLNFARP